MENTIKILVFDIWGEFGHFKKFYTTSSPLTFSVPPPTAIFGMLGAILGFEKDEYLNHINADTTKVGVQVLKPVQKTRISLNLIDTKNSRSFHLIKNRTQVKTEFIRNPAYRVFIHHKDKNLFNKLIDYLKLGKTYYTVSLGLANLIANLKFNGIYDAKFLDEVDKITTIILARNVESIDIKPSRKYFKERLPINMASNREVLNYEDVIIEIQGKKLEGKFKNCYKIDNECISLV